MNQKNYIVYLHRFPNGKVYIGVTSTHPTVRWKNGQGYCDQPLMKRAIDKYGWDNVSHEILFSGLSKAQAAEKEKQLISQYSSTNPEFGYNVSEGGDGTSLHTVSLQTRERLREVNLGKPKSEETKKKLSESCGGRVPWNKSKKTGPNYAARGKKRSPEFCAHMSSVRRGRTLPDEVKKKLSEASKASWDERRKCNG